MMSRDEIQIQQQQRQKVVAKPKGTGRKKIEIKKIEKNSSRKVAFSKRRKGMFKKATELCRLCDVHIAIIVFSPKGRPFCLGHHVIHKFLQEHPEQDDPILLTDLDLQVTKDHYNHDYDCDYDCVTVVEEAQQVGIGFWWEQQSIDDLNMEELHKYKSHLEELRHNVAIKLEEMLMRTTCEMDFLGVSPKP